MSFSKPPESSGALLKSLKSGQWMEILDFQGDSVLLERMHEMGLHKAMKLRYQQRAPFGGPFLFQTPTTSMALREEEMLCLKLKML